MSEQSLSQLPDGVEVVVDGTEGTVIHSTFQASGTVEDAAGFPVEGAILHNEGDAKTRAEKELEALYPCFYNVDFLYYFP